MDNKGKGTLPSAIHLCDPHSTSCTILSVIHVCVASIQPEEGTAVLNGDHVHMNDR